ncbi:TonB-dependent receptor [bacterium]|nr:TonB-dependent receptor [bacterium]
MKKKEAQFSMLNFQFSTFLKILFLILFAFPAAAEEAQSSDEVFVLPTVQVTATRLEKSVDEVPATVGVMTRQDIVERMPYSLTDVLKDMPGVHQSRDGILGTQVNIRGMSSQEARVPVLVDGQPVRGGRVRTFTLFDPDQVERIEVIRGGAGSSIYGSDGLTGVVNVITRRARPNPDGTFRWQARTNAGYSTVNEYARGRLELGGARTGFDSLLGMTFWDADNTRTPAGDIKNSQFKNFSMDLKSGYEYSEKHHFDVTAKIIRGKNIGFPNGLGAPGPPTIIRTFDPGDQDDVSVFYEGRELMKGLPPVRAGWFYKKQKSTPNHIDRSKTRSDTTSIQSTPVTTWGLNVFTVFDVDRGGRPSRGALTNLKHRLTLGSDFVFDKRHGTITRTIAKYFNADGSLNNQTDKTKKDFPDAIFKDVGLFFQDEIEATERLSMTATGRYDHAVFKTEFEPATTAAATAILKANPRTAEDARTGSFGLIYRLSETLDLNLSAATSFRAPEPLEKYGFTVKQIPNPELKSEKGKTYEGGFRFHTKKARGRFTYFITQVRDLIVSVNTVFAGNNVTQRQNVSRVEYEGYELEWSAPLGRGRTMFGNLSYVRGTNKTDRKPMSAAPPMTALAGVRHDDPAGRFDAELACRMVDRQNQIDPTAEFRTPGYSVFDLRGGVDLQKIYGGARPMRLTLGVDNILNKQFKNHLTRESVSSAQTDFNPIVEPGINFKFALTTEY